MKVREIIQDCAKWSPARDYNAASPDVSVLLPTFRRAKSGLLSEAVESVLEQSYKNLELIIIDDASTDGTADLIAEFMKKDPRVSCIRHQYNVGLPAISEYEGYRKARGKYIAFIFDDNVWEQDYLEKAIHFMEINQAMASYSIVHSCNRNGGYIELGISSNEFGIHYLPFMNFIANGGVILAREVIETVGLYDPHVIMTRLCDWGLWKRITRKYEFYETGIFAGVEKGASQNDSLGNTYKMNSWACAEREAQVKDEMLIPSNFENVEINFIAPCSSEFYRGAVRTFYAFYKQKEWYQEETIPEAAAHPLRILVVASAYDATISLAFLRLIDRKNSVVFKFQSGGVPLYEITQADVVILVRNAASLEPIKQICLALEIPCILYIDDNFILLAEDYKSELSFQQLKQGLSVEQLRQYHTIVTPTNALTDFFKEMDEELRVATVPPCIGEIHRQNLCDPSSEEPYTFAYMGGMFRDQDFTNVVMPALMKLAESHKVRVLCPSRLTFDKYRDIKDLEIVSLEYSPSLDTALMRYAKYKPHFLLHCGPDIKNNRYKTENALFNAVQLGAILVASNRHPFALHAGKNCMCAENTPEAWYRQLYALISNVDVQKEIFQNAYGYCTRTYDPSVVLSAWKTALSEIHPGNMYELAQRDEQAIQMLLNNSHPKISRPLGKIPLGYTGDSLKKCCYRITCHSDTISELGICFSSYGVPVGVIKADIYVSGQLIRKSEMNMKDFVRDGWSYFVFDPVEVGRGKLLDVCLRFEYDKGSAMMGLFEVSAKRSFLFRLLKKLGYRMKICDLLFADCR